MACYKTINIWNYSKSQSYRNDLGIDYLTFAGGGVKGVSYIGVLKSLLREGVLKNIKSAAGTSVGSIFAFLSTCDITLDQINYISDSLEIENLINKYNNWISKTLSLSDIYNNLGLNDGNKIINFIEDTLEELNFEKEITFKEFFKLTNKNPIIVSANLNQGETMLFSAYHTPESKISFAIRSSIAVPIFFTPMHHLEDCKPQLLIDGGVFDNYPLNIYDYQEDECVLGINRRVVGFLPLNNGQIYGEANINNIQSYLRTLLELMQSRIQKMNTLQELFWERTVPLECYDIQGLNFELSHENKNKLIKIGELSTDKFLENRSELLIQNNGFPDELFMPSYKARCEKITIPNYLINHTLSVKGNKNLRLHHGLGEL